jgi:CHAT domain-containing protein/tetratricopeptide (TPR) repeat protein
MTMLLAALLVAQAPAADRPPRCEALYQEGRRLYFDGRFEEARARFRTAQACAREGWGQVDTLSQRYEGLCFQYEDRLDEALALFRSAAEELLARARSARGGLMPETNTGVADALNNIGWLLHLKGEDAAARVELSRALALASDGPLDRASGVWIHGRVRTNLAVVAGALGEASTADAELRLVVATQSGDRMNRTRALEQLGRLEESWGDLEAALARYEEALATGEAGIRDTAPTPYNRAYLVGSLSRLGLLRERLGRTAAAREALDRALATARELGTRQLVAQVLLDRGRLARESGDVDSALASHEEALALATSARLEPAEALALAELGWDTLARDHAEAALGLFDRSLASKAVAETPETLGSVRSGIARARERLGQLAPAAEQDDLAVEAVEAVRLGTLAEPHRLGFWRLRQGIFRSAIALRHRLLVETGDTRHAERALELAEEARSRALLDLISRGVVPVGPEGEGRAWPVARLRSELLGPDTGLVEFTLDEPRSWAWILTRDACIMAALPGRAEIERTVSAWRKSVTSATPYDAASHGEAARLFALLLSGLAPRLESVRRIVVAGDGVLHLVPFEALEDARGRLVLEGHVVSYAPSASVAGALHARRAARSATAVRLLAYAEPESALGPLPLARREARGIAALFPAGASDVRQGAQASESWLKRAELEHYGTLHFATHGTYDDRAPARSALVLAPGQGEDGRLHLREIESLTLRAGLVSLSACDTGLGEVVTGEGVVGLARAFLRAGADAVAMTLWRIPDASTAELMRRFYVHMRAGMPGAEALREAKLELLRGPAPRRAPFHWAGVVLTGDPSSGLPPF